MIDFRYHLVSLVSVFLALAVGIVLGAGPLKETIGSTLTEQVSALRDEKDGLRVQLGTATSGLEHRDEFLTTVTPSMVGGQLANSSVAIVALPGVDDEVVDPLVEAITNAGGRVTGRISLNDAWVDPQKADARTKAVTDLSVAEPSLTTTGETDDRLAGMLAAATVTVGADPVAPSTQASSAVLDALRSADLIEVKGNVSGLAGGALLLAPANPVDAAVKATPADDTMASYVSLAGALDTAGGGTVVTGPASAATDGGVLAAIRNDDSIKSRVSTVDTGSQPIGVITSVLAIREQLDGGSGAYGFGGGATAQLPPLAVTAPGVSPGPTATKK